MPPTGAACPAPTRCFQVRQHACIHVHGHTNSNSSCDYYSVIYLFPADSQSSPMVRGGLLGSVRAPQSSATCVSWGGAHYRTFDRKHFHFQGSCTYLLASSTDGTWTVYMSTVCGGGGECSKVCPSPVTRQQFLFVFFSLSLNASYHPHSQALRMMFGLDLVSIHHRNLTLNSLSIPNGEPVFQNGKFNSHSVDDQIIPGFTY